MDREEHESIFAHPPTMGLQPRRIPVSVSNQLRDIFAAADRTVNLSLRLQQKFFGQSQTDEARGPSPSNIEGWLAAISAEQARANTVLEQLNERIEAD